MSSDARNPRDLFSADVGEQSWSDRELRLREALAQWLRWNEAHEHLTEQLFAAGGDPGKTEELLDQLDALREEAVRLSRELLD